MSTNTVAHGASDHGLAFLSGEGEMGALMRAHDWSSSPLGQPEDWPQSLRTVVSLMLNSRYPMFIAWGPNLTFLYNDGYKPIFGAKHPDALGQPFAEIWSEIWADVKPLVDRALAGEATFSENLHLVMERNGFPEDTWYTFSYSPVHDETGGIGGMFCACQETTSQVLLERRLEAQNERLQQLFQQAPGFMAMLSGRDHVFELVNPAYMQLIGHRDVHGKPVRTALPEVVGQGLVELLDSVFESGEPYTGNSFKVGLQRTPGAAVEERYVDFVFQPIIDGDGKVTGIFVEGYDVTERVHGDAHLRLLMNELNHRLKNTLATVQAIVAQTLKGSGALDEARENLSARIMSLSRTQDLLTSENWHGADLLRVVSVAVGPYAGRGDSRFRISGPPVPLGPHTALALSLALHELATNAAKYGALSTDRGWVEIKWYIEQSPEPALRLEWRESEGPTVVAPSRKGFGTHLIERGLAMELEAQVTLDYPASGFVFTLSAALADLEHRVDA